MLSIVHLSHVYPNGTRALDDVTLTVPRGMFGLLGPNGAGKSTLMRAIATLQIPTSGSITLETDGQRVDVLREPQALRSLLGYLPQDFGVYPRVSALDMLDHLRGPEGHRRAPRAPGGGRRPAGTGEPVGRAQEGAGRIFRRHAPAFRDRAGADRKSAS